MARKPRKSTKEVKYPNVRERNGLFRFRYDIINPETGKRKQKETKGYETALEAFQAGMRILDELNGKTYVEEKNMTFKDYIDDWIKSYRAHGNVKESTIFIREFNLKKAAQYLGHIKLKEITKKQYQDMLDDLKLKGSALNSIKLVHVSCKMLFQTAVEQEIIKTNPTTSAKLPSFVQTVEQLESEVSLPRYLEKDELLKFLEVVKQHGSPQDYTVFFLLSYTGLRIGEITALKWTDINRKELFISIKKNLYIRGGVENFILTTPKTKSSVREVDITEKVLSVLDSHSVWQKELIMARRDKYYNGNFVFVNDTYKPGYPMINEVPERRMKEFLAIANLPTSLTPHSLRHTHTSLLAEAGEDLEVIQRRLGHKNDKTTRDIYLHVTKKRKKEAPLRFERFLESN